MMLRLLERNIESLKNRLILLAPQQHGMPQGLFQRAKAHPASHSQRLRQMQRFRGAIYLADGALQEHQLTLDRRHHTPEDERSWHFLMLDRDGQLSSCAWYMVHGAAVSIDKLRARGCPLNQPAHPHRHQFRRAIDDDMRRARRRRISFAELGGWAVAPEARGTCEVLLLALAVYSLSRHLGGALGLTTATFRHASAKMLQRLGGEPLKTADGEIPAYFDARYNCDMQLLRFDSETPTERYLGLMQQVRDQLVQARVVSARPVVVPRERMHPPVSHIASQVPVSA